jgi:hypothetical protein
MTLKHIERRGSMIYTEAKTPGKAKFIMDFGTMEEAVEFILAFNTLAKNGFTISKKNK